MWQLPSLVGYPLLMYWLKVDHVVCCVVLSCGECKEITVAMTDDNWVMTGVITERGDVNIQADQFGFSWHSFIRVLNGFCKGCRLLCDLAESAHQICVLELCSYCYKVNIIKMKCSMTFCVIWPYWHQHCHHMMLTALSMELLYSLHPAIKMRCTLTFLVMWCNWCQC